MSPIIYNAYDCEQLREEEARLLGVLNTVSKEQRDAKSGDAWGVALWCVPTSSMSGKNVAAQVADVKGRIKALQEEKNIKKCIKNNDYKSPINH